MKYNLVCGFETHIELSTKEKLFCPCKVTLGSEPNSNCCPICIGAPGTLPALNREAVIYAIKMGLALNCKINLFSKMERKCYFYPDLAKAYQISQNDLPLCGPGFVELDSGKKIRIHHIHIEEDAGKIKNESDGIYVDYNRSGVPLIEIVSEPDISSIEEAQEYIEKLQLTARYVRVSDARMQEGSIRCDVNISVKPENSDKLGTRIEIKNMNSISFIAKALKYEYERQVDVLESGGQLIQETRRFNEQKNCTEGMREKEDASDYGYFPEPNLPSICLEQEKVDEIKKNLPEMYYSRKKRYINLGVPEKTASLLVKYVNVSDFFDLAIKNCKSPERVANLIIGQIFSFLGSETEKEEFKISVSPQDLNYLVNLIADNKLNMASAKNLLSSALEAKGNLKDLTDKFISESPKFDLKAICSECTEACPEAVQDYLNGKEKALQAIIGKVMAKTRGSANAAEAKNIIISIINEKKDVAKN